jgi:ATP-dependent Lon protease
MSDGDTEVSVVLPADLPVLPAKDIVAFPSVMMALYVGRRSSIQAVEAAIAQDKLIFLVAQRNTAIDEPSERDLYEVGVVASIMRLLKLPEDRYKVIVQGLTRARATSYQRGEYLTAHLDGFKEVSYDEMTIEQEGIFNRIRENLQILVEREHLPEEMLLISEDDEDPAVMCDTILAHYRLEVTRAQAALEEVDPLERLKLADSIIADDLNQILLSETIRDRARDEMNKGQREYYLREQIKQIQEELGENDSSSKDVNELKESLEVALLPKEAKKEVERQLVRLERIPVESTEYALLRTYLEWIADLPWSIRTKERLNLKRAKKVLDRDHYGLEKAKDRILEYLSVRKLNRSIKGPILCFVGPPGVGKTSLGRSVARALGRKFFRMSLGGVRDEAEIRGHRRTYVGSLPGRIIQGLKQAGSNNPVFVLDEIDKVGNDFRGDPASALLEVLDPSQNEEFRDHYLNLSFDLSDILFIATANTVDTIPEALLDRLEIIFISGYTLEEKVKIAKQFIIPRQRKENGLEMYQLQFQEEALVHLIERYTAEAGVRGLEREIASLCRKVARLLAEGSKAPKRVTTTTISHLLGPTKYDPELRDARDLVGVARGLAWTVNGGEMMPVEVSIAKGNGTLTMTGQLGSIMQESAQAAVFYARANAEILGVDPNFQQKYDIHVHVPGGATPKDGPSAGITIACALVSALSGRKISNTVAMTGEITLRGNVLAVGGLKEKALAALRHGTEKVIIPYENLKDLEEIPKEQRRRITFVPVRYVGEIFEVALLPKELRRRARIAKDKAVKQSKRPRSIATV